MRKTVSYIISVIMALCLIFAALITSVEAVCYWNPGYFEREYEKHEVLASLPEMKLTGEDSLMTVTEHMMKYLRGDEDAPTLQIEVTMGGQKRGFFTEREILHMEDVRDLFVGAQQLRAGALVLILAGAALLWILRDRKDKGSALRIFCRGMLLGTGLMLVLAALLGVVLATDFSNAFVTFHHIFFDNDLWILDPRVDMLVNIVPEGFFFDTAARILGLFLGALVLLCGLSLWYLGRGSGRGSRRSRRRENKA